MGAQLKKNLRDAWWQDMIMLPCWGRKGPDGDRVRCVPVETTIIQHPKVWEASGHISGFNDPMVDDKETKGRFRADHLQGVFDDRGGSGDPDSIARELLRECLQPGSRYSRESFLQSEQIPTKTIVANNEVEAVQQLEGDKKLQKLLGIRVLKTYFGSE